MTEYQVHDKIVPDAWDLTRETQPYTTSFDSNAVYLLPSVYSHYNLRTALQQARIQLRYGPVYIHILNNNSCWIYECNSHKDIALHFD